MDEDRPIIELFHALDRLPGPEHLEFPDGFDLAQARMRALLLRKRLNDVFSREHQNPVRLDDRIQDASYYFALRIPPRATEAGEWICVRLSNYGDLAVILAPRPDSHPDLDAAVAAGALSEGDRKRVETTLTDLGYRVVPPRLLHRPYDGVTWLADSETDERMAAHSVQPGEATWWTRFFEYL
ncbi:hypothetical protein RKD49_004219 [Streptomyces glaucescens]